MRVCVPCYNVDNVPSCVLLSTKFEKLIWGSTICFPLCENKTKQSQQEIPSNSTCPTYCWRGCFKKCPPLSCAPSSEHFLPRWFSKCCPWTPEGPEALTESLHIAALSWYDGDILCLFTGLTCAIGEQRLCSCRFFLKCQSHSQWPGSRSGKVFVLLNVDPWAHGIWLFCVRKWRVLIETLMHTDRNSCFKEDHACCELS